MNSAGRPALPPQLVMPKPDNSMPKPGGPCQGPGRNGSKVCGATEVPGYTWWRTGKGDYAGKPCCQRNKCMETMHLKKKSKKSADAPAAANLEPAAAGAAPAATAPVVPPAPAAPAAAPAAIAAAPAVNLEPVHSRLSALCQSQCSQCTLNYITGLRQGQREGTPRIETRTEILYKSDDPAVIKMLQGHLKQAEETIRSLAVELKFKCDSCWDGKRLLTLDEMPECRMRGVLQKAEDVNDLLGDVGSECIDELAVRAGVLQRENLPWFQE